MKDKFWIKESPPFHHSVEHRTFPQKPSSKSKLFAAYTFLCGISFAIIKAMDQIATRSFAIFQNYETKLPTGQSPCTFNILTSIHVLFTIYTKAKHLYKLYKPIEKLTKDYNQ